MSKQPLPRSPSSVQDPAGADVTRAFALKVRLSTWALFFERLWPRLWLFLGLCALIAALSLTGTFNTLSAGVHVALMALFGALGLAAVVYAARVPWPDREEAIRRIERRSGVPHRPATSYEDTLTAFSQNVDTETLWKAHKDRLARAISRLRVGRPSPRADRFDPIALRVLALLLLIPAAGLVPGSLYERLVSAFRFGKAAAQSDARADAWVTPPAYTAQPPIMLHDGSVQPLPAAAKGNERGKMLEVPEKSTLTYRGSGFGSKEIALEVLTAGAKDPVRIVPEAETPKAGDQTHEPGKTTADQALKAGSKPKIDISEIRYELKTSARIRALAGSEELARWTFDVIPDQLPKITLNKDFSNTPKGSLKLSYKGEDDYGVATAVAKVKQLKQEGGDPSKAWARHDPVKGPRLPLERPPVLALKIPAGSEKKFESVTLLELGSHPWAGQLVELWLEATDVAGQVGRSESIQIALPARRFYKPLARAIIEQRRKLAEDSRNRPMVVRALDALAIEPEGFIDSAANYLALRSIFHRIERDNSRSAINSAIDHMWNLALKIEDGALSDAEKAMKDAQDRLSKALENGASEEEIRQLVQELKQAMAKYLEEMQKNAEKDGNQNDEPQGEKRKLTQEDIDQMMRDLEESAKNGSREEAERLLSEMKELMERAQANKSPEQEENDRRAQEMLKKLDQLSDMSGKQQKLMDDTFGEERNQQQLEKQNKGGGKQPKGGTPNKGSQKGKQGETGEGGSPDENGQAQQRQQASPQDGMAGAEQRPDGRKGLKDRQTELRRKLEKLQQELQEMGAGGNDRMKDAESAMKQAEDSLEKGDLPDATQSQGEALDKMRQSAQQMAEQLAKDAKNRTGRNTDQRRDPLDRPQRAEGPDMGNSVKVPNAIDAQRAREILEELRKRSGEALRPRIELDYIERLLKRF